MSVFVYVCSVGDIKFIRRNVQMLVRRAVWDVLRCFGC